MDNYQKMQKRINRKKRQDRRLAAQAKKEQTVAVKKTVGEKKNEISRTPVIATDKAIRKRRNKIIVNSVISVLLVVIAIFCICNISYLTPSRLPERIKALNANSGKGSGFPYSYNTTYLVSICSFGSNNTALLNKDTLVLLNGSAKPVLSYAHTMAAPNMCISADRILLYDMGAKRVELLNQSGMLYNLSTNYPVVCADISLNSDKFVVVTSKTGQTKVVSVYSRKNKKVFSWSSGSGYVIDAAISPNGRNLAVAIIDTENAVAVSTVICFDILSGEQKSRTKYEDTSVYDISFVNNKSVAVMSDKSLSVKTVNNKDIYSVNFKASVNYQLYSDSKGNIIYLYSLYNSGDYYLDVYSNKGKKLIKKKIQKPVWSYSDSGTVAVLQENNELSVFTPNSQTEYRATVGSNSKRFSLKGKTVFVADSGEIKKVSLKKV